ncbi:MAG: 16S rRNA (adenine(1518)-N(6)/adenine(1519)-N(6))-dimethyltransferase RsmA [Eubacteriaceae bacterium]|nr:16S rRNA (adenine(1518)-N(6)/adenine(1519)-N(6))-dimethyltransferase RsmA [Eubacteriaceae bacterium]
MGELTSLKTLKELMAESSFYFKKDYGQNFLIDGNIAEKIVEIACENNPGLILEVGAGAGALTELAVGMANEVIAVEIDYFCIKMLESALGGYGNLSLIQEDFLKTDIHGLLKEHIQAGKSIGVISNLPYYITSPIILKLLESGIRFCSITAMMQKEVADRLAAGPGSKAYSSFSVAVDYYAQTQKRMVVSRNVFYPSPKVDSAVVTITQRDEKKVKLESEDLFFAVVRSGFGQRRKTLLNSLSAGLGREKAVISKVLGICGIPENERAEKLDMQQFADIANTIALGKF